MKRGLIFLVAVIVIVTGLSTTASARTGAWHYYDGAYRWVDYGRSYGHYRSRPMVQVDVGYSYGYGRGPAGYPQRSLFDSLTGETDRKVLQIQEKEQDFRHYQEDAAAHRTEEERLFAWAAQRSRDQKLEDENQTLKAKIAELEAQKKEDENRRLRERIAELEKQQAKQPKPEPKPEPKQQPQPQTQ